MKRWTCLLAAGCAAVALTGCGEITEQHAAQQDLIGPVQVTTSACVHGFGSLDGTPPPGSGCTSPLPGAQSGQVLLGYLVPTGVKAPATLTATLPAGLTFTRSAAYAAALKNYYGEGPDVSWVGYISDTTTIPGVNAGLPVRVDATFPLPVNGDASPFDGPFQIVTAVGDREVSADPGEGADRPLQCEASQTQQLAQAARIRRAVRSRHRGPRARTAISLAPGITWPGFRDTKCFDATSPVKTETDDLGILAGATVTAKAGTTATVPFRAVFAGPALPGDAAFALAATTTAPGAQAAPAAASLAPQADSTTPQDVTVAVPAGAAPGRYAVTLTASLPGGQLRSGTGTLQVVAADVPQDQVPPPPPPVKAQSLPAPPAPPALVQHLRHLDHISIGELLTKGIPVTFDCNRACQATIDLLIYQPPAHRAGIARVRHWRQVKTILIGRRFSGLSAAGTKHDRVQLFPLPGGRLPHLGRFTLIVRTTAVDSDGHRTSAIVRKVHLKPGCTATPCVRR